MAEQVEVTKRDMAQFMFELEQELLDRLKTESYKRSATENRRVSMSEIVRVALERELGSGS